jgi:hypothetical protein
MNWLTKPDSEGFSDYSTYLLKVEKLERAIHDACLENDYKQALALTDELVEQSVLLRKWFKSQK